jgi:hypothetical protein
VILQRLGRRVSIRVPRHNPFSDYFKERSSLFVLFEQTTGAIVISSDK